ncbi:aminotransferase class I/II-fold pyridoxal phosphate-dependent enzyme [Chloroflexota bacterium]
MKKDFYPFMLERDMSVWENKVKYNLSESGVHPMTITDLAEGDNEFVERILTSELNYAQANGVPELRDNIAALYPDASRDNVIVTTGAAQANFTSILTALDPGDEIVVMLPNYMQIYGIGINYGLHVKTFSLKEELGWSVDIDEIGDVVSDKTRLIAVCNPNNPTGHIMTDDEMNAVIKAAERAGAWLLSDEVYAGAEHHQEEVTPSFWGRYDRVLAVGSMSKAYGLPGLRIGWVVAAANMVDEIWARQDYVTISASMLGNKLAAYALSPEVLPRIIARTRQYVRSGYKNLDNWVQEHSDLLSVIPPQASAIAFVRYHKEVNSSELVQRLIKEHDTYIVPGDLFGLDHHLRISYGLSADFVNEGLSRIYQTLMSFAN